jgi:hypothetical protein
MQVRRQPPIPFPTATLRSPPDRIFYYPGARFDVALLIQSLVMVVIQVILLKIALDNRPAPASKGGDGAVPFARANEGFWERARPYKFWQWRSSKPCVEFQPMRFGCRLRKTDISVQVLAVHPVALHRPDGL